jgi:hypothetical protein
MDGIHNEGGLHRHETSETTVSSFQLLTGKAVLHIVGAGTPIAMELHPEKAQFPNFRDYLHGKGGLFKVIINEGHESIIHEPSHRIPSNLLFVAEKVIYTQIIQTLKFGHGSLRV